MTRDDLPDIPWYRREPGPRYRFWASITAILISIVSLVLVAAKDAGPVAVGIVAMFSTAGLVLGGFVLTVGRWLR